MPKLVITYLLVQAISLVAFWAVLDSTHALGYTILFIGIIQPLVIFAAIGLLAGTFLRAKNA